MKAATYKLDDNLNLTSPKDHSFNEKETQLAICFGTKKLIQDHTYFKFLRSVFPSADLIFTSTSGEIYETEVNDDSISIAAIQFENTPTQSIQLKFQDFENSEVLGNEIYNKLYSNDLRFIYILSDAGEVNGSELVSGLNKDNFIHITGGLAGDGIYFEKTVVGLNEIPQSGNVVAIGFYGDSIRVSDGSLGGWQEFGLSRKITKSHQNILLEVDGQNILDLYKRYLGRYKEELPSSALLFPLSLQTAENEDKLVRTILGFDDERKSLRFAGDMPVGSKVRFMKSNGNNLIEASRKATQLAMASAIPDFHPKLALVVSCVGRKLVLKKRVEEEIEEIREVLGSTVPIAGFYSYGEIAPLQKGHKCFLHNQTLTITLFDEVS